ncbi:urea transporter [Sporosarcina sp. FSL W8-0480]|uniref:urea transporter n=1 Tax=Sporosarcina sp. FSL W8-0480 TaxID=2954701 RepID=UPI0030DD70B9
MALYLFLEGPVSWGIALFGAVISAVITASVMRFLQPAGMPTMTFPYIVTTCLSEVSIPCFCLSDYLP